MKVIQNLFVFLCLLFSSVTVNAESLHILAISGNSEGVEKAIKNGANVNEKDDGITPLMFAVSGFSEKNSK